MAQYLALDIGRRRTGVAIGDPVLGIPFPYPTLIHSSLRDLVTQVRALMSTHHISLVCVGMPLLPSGEEGEQARFVHQCVQCLKKAGIPVELIDERYSSYGHKEDIDAKSACTILSIAFALFAKNNKI